MHKKLILPLAFLFFAHASNAQVADKIEKAHNDPATKTRSEKADALLIDKKKITPEVDSTQRPQRSAAKKKGRCNKKSAS